MAQTFFFYDLETSGLNPRDDRIMQFAGIRTDADFNIIGEPYNPDSADYPNVSAIAQAIKDTRVSEYDEKNPSAIFLVDVEIRTNSIDGPFKMPYVCLFLDQILGVSIGKFEKPTEE